MIRLMHNDPILRIETNLTICTKEGELVPFILNSFQRKLVCPVMDGVRTDGGAERQTVGDLINGPRSHALEGGELCASAMRIQRAHGVGHQVEQDVYCWPIPSMESDSRRLRGNRGSAIESRLANRKSQGRSTEVGYYGNASAVARENSRLEQSRS
jgi:hypothetical protein